MDNDAVFDAIEKAIHSEAIAIYGPQAQIQVHIDRPSGKPRLIVNGKPVDEKELGTVLGQFSAQKAKQILVGKIRNDEEPRRNTEENEHG